MKKAELIERYALEAVGSPYIYGATAKPCTVSLRNTQAKQYPDAAAMITKYCMKLSKNQPCSQCRYNGRLAYDCAQLVRFAAKAAGIDLVSGATSQWRKTAWQAQGEISTAPAGRLIIVFRQADGCMQHVGIMLPDGSSIHAKGHAYGVIHDKPGAYPWTHWGLLPGMDEAAPDPNAQKNTDPAKEAEKPSVIAGMKATVTARSGSTVNLRRKPGGELIAPVAIGSEARVLETKDGWCRVRVEVEGWMQNNYLSKKE